MIRFADVIDQKLAASVLTRAIREDKINHAYLFSGPEGVGKTTTALAFAAALNCESPTADGDACGSCTSCHMVAGRNHPDVEIISPDGAQTKMKQMQEMRRMAQYAPVKGKWKVVIIEQADTMNEDSSNSILKTLEEPPCYLVLILLSRNPALLLTTIRSRCLMVRFSTATAEELAEALAERFGADTEEARFLAAYSEGRPGVAISLVGNEEFFEWRKDVVRLAENICTSDRWSALRLSEDMQKLARGEGQRAQMRLAIDALILLYRDLLSISIRGDGAQIINSDIRDTLAATSPHPVRVSKSIETLLWARRALEGNANIQLLSDVLMMRLLS